MIDNFNSLAEATFYEELREWDAARKLSLPPPTCSDRLDVLIGEIVARFDSADAPTRLTICQAVGEFGQKQLLRYAASAAEIAVRQHALKWAEDGLTALVIEGGSESVIESYNTMALLCHSADKLGANRSALFDAAADKIPKHPRWSILEPTMRAFPRKSEAERQLSEFYSRESGENDAFHYLYDPPWKVS